MGRQPLLLQARPSAPRRHVAVVGVFLLALYVFVLSPRGHPDVSAPSQGPGPWVSPPRPAAALLRNRFLGAAECAAAFPGLTDEVDRAVSEGPFTLQQTSTLGSLVARIRDGKLFVLQAAARADLSQDMLQHRSATLNQIANALLTWPHRDEIPDTVVAFNHHDDPLPRTFSYCRPQGSPGHYFPIPHFSFYSWPIATVGSLARAAAAITKLESGLEWDEKRPQAVWRGTPHFNSAQAGRMRQELLVTTRNASWADIEALRGSPAGGDSGSGDNALAIEDFCRYRYIVHTEGITYSGRLHFHQLCASVVLTPPLAWPQHLSPFIRPVFSYDLPGVVRTVRAGAELGHGVREKTTLASYPAPWVAPAWPRSYDAAAEANMVFVAPDWSDLGATITWLEANPGAASAIARRQRKLFDGGGLLSPAAENCYWRAAIRGWAGVARFDDQEFDNMRETPWEEFSLKEVHR